jgi:hypothetical protein
MRWHPNPVLPLFALMLCAQPIWAAAGSASLAGRLVDDRGKAITQARILLINKIAGYRQVAQPNDQGRFVFHNIPFNDYHLEVFAKDFQAIHQAVELRTSLPLEITVPMRPQGITVAVEETLSIVEEHPSTHLDIDQSTIERIPAAVQSRALESILLATPGFVANDNGRFHFRGSHGQLTYVVDGIPLSDHAHATYSNSMDPAQINSMEIITGGISAEYGGKPVAVVNMTTRSGLGTPHGFAGEVSLGGARFSTYETGATVQGGSNRFGYFVTSAASRTDRFLDPVDFRNFHNQGETGRLFSRFDWVLGDRDTLRFSVSGGKTDRDVVNLASQEARGMDQGVMTQDANASLGWSHLFSANQSLDVSAYTRRATSQLDPSRNLTAGFSEGGPDYPVWASQDRSLENWGAQIAFNQRFFADSTFKTGLQYVAFPIQERFRFAITSDAYVTDSDSPLYAYTPSGGGGIWNFDDRITPTLASAFAQSDLHFGNLFLALGLRYDAWTLRGETDDEFQPRLGVSYRIPSTRTIFRASYDRLFITPDRENLALSSSHEAAELGEHEEEPGHGHGTHQVRPEVQDAWNVGMEQQFGGWGRLNLDYWERWSRNTADVEQFLNTGIEFPIALAHGYFHGFNLRFDVTTPTGFSGYLSVGKTRALVEGPTTGGLEVHAGSHEHGEASGRFPIDHDQKASAQLGLRYEQAGWWAQILGRHDSGLVAGDPDEAEGNPDLAFGLDHIRYDGDDQVWRVKSRTTWNVGLGRTFRLGGHRMEMSGNLLNAFDEKSLYNFMSHRGGTHVFPPRTWAFRVKYAF